MATPTLVQSVMTGADNQTGPFSPTPTLKITLPNATLGSNLLVLALQYDTGFTAASTTVTDNISNTWVRLNSTTYVGDAGSVQFEIWYVVGATAGVTAVTAAFTAGGGNTSKIQGHFSEWYNVATTSALDSSSHNTGTGTSSPYSVGSYTVTSGDLVLTYGYDEGQGSGILTKFTAGSNASLMGADINSGGGSASGAPCGVIAEYQIAVSSGSLNPGFSTSGNTTDWYGSISVAFKSAAAGTAPSLVPRIVAVQHQYLGAVSTGSTHPMQNNLQFPCPSSGNLLVGLFNDDTIYLSALTDSASNSWQLPSTARAVNINSPGVTGQIVYASAATCAPTLATLAFTYNASITSGNPFIMLVAVTGAATSAFDVAAATTGVHNSSGATTTVSITPTTTGGIVFAVLGVVNNDVNVVSVSGQTVILDSVVDAALNDGNTTGASSLDEDNGYAHVYNTTTSAKTFVWTATTGGTNAGIGQWAAAAIAFKAASAAAPGIPIEWPMPVARAYPTDYRTFLNASPTRLIGKDKFYGGVGQGPFYEYPNPVPKVGPFPYDLRSTINQTPRSYVIGTDKLFAPGLGWTFDYPNPVPKSYQLDLRTHIWNGLEVPLESPHPAPTMDCALALDDLKILYPPNLRFMSVTYIVSANPPFLQTEWPNPSVAGYQLDLRTETQAGVSFSGVIGPQPFLQVDWPLSRSSNYPFTLRDLIPSNTLIGGVSPFNQTEWPTPTSRFYPQSVGSWLNSLFEVLGAVPFYQQDWPTPPSKSYATDLRQHQNPALNFYGITVVPITPTTTDIQILPFYPSNLRRLIVGYVSSPVAPFAPQPFEVPRSSIYPSYALNVPPSQLQLISVAAPFSVPEWTNPSIPHFSPALRSTVNPSLASIIIGVAPFYQTQWDNPTPKSYASDLRIWIQSHLSTTPFHQSEWPNPLARTYPCDIRTFLNAARGLPFSSIVPFYQLMWTNTPQSYYSVDLRSLYNAAITAVPIFLVASPCDTFTIIIDQGFKVVKEGILFVPSCEE